MNKIFCVYETYKVDYPQHNYIGKTTIHNLQKKKYKGGGVLLNFAFKKHGKGAFKTTILKEFDTEDEAYTTEIELIASKKPYYNIHCGGPTVWSNQPIPTLDLEECNLPVPFKVIIDKSLSSLNLRVFLLLVRLSLKEGYVQARHCDLSEIVGSHPQTIAKSLKTLKKIGYIGVERVGLNMPNKIFIVKERLFS